MVILGKKNATGETAISRLAGAALCGIAAGIITGIAARLAMRMVADGLLDNIRQLPDFTLAGSLTIVITGAVAGAAGGALFSWVHDTMPGPQAFRGLAVGLVLLSLIGPLFFVGARDEFITTQRAILFALLFPIYGVSAGLALRTSRGLAAKFARPAQIVLALIGLGSAALMASLLLGFAVQAMDVHGAPALASAIPWIALGMAWLSRRSTRAPLPLRRDARA